MKLTLNPKELAEEFFTDTRLLGVMSSTKDYQFCWQLNSFLGYSFRNNTEIEIQLTRKKRNYFFAVYEYLVDHTSIVHYIYNNQFDGEYLLPEFKHLDFLWLIKGDEIKENELQHLIQSIRSVTGVQLVVELTNEKIKNKDHMVF